MNAAFVTFTVHLEEHTKQISLLYCIWVTDASCVFNLSMFFKDLIIIRIYKFYRSYSGRYKEFMYPYVLITYSLLSEISERGDFNRGKGGT